jgi:hypothetical protein
LFHNWLVTVDKAEELTLMEMDESGIAAERLFIHVRSVAYGCICSFRLSRWLIIEKQLALLQVSYRPHNLFFIAD